MSLPPVLWAAGGIMFSTWPFVCVRAHVRVGMEEFSDRLAVDF